MANEAEPETKTPEVNPKITALWNDLTDEASTNLNEAFKNIIRSDEYEYNGDKYYFRMLNHKDTGILKKLQGVKLNEEEDWDGYVNNYRERAKLLIKDMTDEKFDNGDFFILENLITAWSIRATKGFRHLLKSV